MVLSKKKKTSERLKFSLQTQLDNWIWFSRKHIDILQIFFICLLRNSLVFSGLRFPFRELLFEKREFSEIVTWCHCCAFLSPQARDFGFIFQLFRHWSILLDEVCMLWIYALKPCRSTFLHSCQFSYSCNGS